MNGIPFLEMRSITGTRENGGAEAFGRNCGRVSEISAEVTREMLREWAHVSK
ncbi:MAG: hypothetical protein K2L38_02575 [Dysosmobacter sp.]|nr:hypothetical protein [Dysosmobacter sp.]